MARSTHSTRDREHTVAGIIQQLEEKMGTEEPMKGWDLIRTSVDRAAGQLTVGSSDAFRTNGAHRKNTENTQQQRPYDIIARIAAEAEEKRATESPSAEAGVGEDVEECNDYRSGILARIVSYAGLGIASLVALAGSSTGENRHEYTVVPNHANLVIAPGTPGTEPSNSPQN